jgi:transcriptional regulator with XRE-family HTH domain
LSKGRGSGKTPEELVKRLKIAVAEKSQSAVAKETGLGLATINSYLKGIGEPTLGTLRKLSLYLGVSVVDLRGETVRDDQYEYILKNSTQIEQIYIKPKIRNDCMIPPTLIFAAGMEGVRLAEQFDGTVKSVAEGLRKIRGWIESLPVAAEDEELPD